MGSGDGKQEARSELGPHSILFGGRTDGDAFGRSRSTRYGTHDCGARHIQALEDELNTRLFHKSNSGCGLTDAGERLLAGAEAIESAYVYAKAEASSEGQTIIGTVRIGAPDGFGCVFLAPRVRALTDRHPGLQIEILA